MGLESPVSPKEQDEMPTGYEAPLASHQAFKDSMKVSAGGLASTFSTFSPGMSPNLQRSF